MTKQFDGGTAFPRLDYKPYGDGSGQWHNEGGMSLRDTNPENDGFNLMDRCTKWSTKVPGREHHAAWFKAIDHPDMRLIEAAPDLLASLIELEPYMHEGEKLQRARAAIRKAKGIL